jgi:hypothetical protein
VNGRTCKRCNAPTWSSKSPYCREHRPPPEVRATWAAKTREARGYGIAHRTLRAQFVRLVEAGQATCARCGLPILPGEPFDLDHADDRSSCLGASHRRCNRVAGAKSGAAVTNARRWGDEPLRSSWSRVWSWPIPPGRYVDAEALREFLAEEAERGEPVDPEEVRAYIEREARYAAGDPS